MNFFNKKKQNFFKNVQQQKEIDFIIPKKYTILFNNDLSEISRKNNFNLSKIKPKKRQNSCDKIINPYLKVYLKPIKEDSKEFKILNQQNYKSPSKKCSTISLIKEEKKEDDKFSLISTLYSLRNSFGEFNILKTPLSKYNENSASKGDLDCKIFGFKNIGHTCYINSFLQILFRTPSFLEKLESSNIGNDKLITCLINLSKYPENIKNMRKLKILMSEVDENYRKYTQKDSQEFGINLINQLISNIKGDNELFDINENDDDIAKDNYISFKDIEIYKNHFFKTYKEKYYKKEDEIFIENMFQFHESRLIIETNINNDIEIKRINFETNLNIDLSFPCNVKKDEFLLEELLDNKFPEYHNFYNEYNNGNEALKYESNWDKIKEMIYNLYKKFIYLCNMDSRYSMNIEDVENSKYINDVQSICFRKLASLPNILIISINRAFLGKSLNTSYLKYMETLDLKNYIDEDIIYDKNTTYKLYAVNECSGIIKNFGHCYSYVKIKNRWFKFDDETVKQEWPNFNSKYVIGLYYIRDN